MPNAITNNGEFEKITIGGVAFRVWPPAPEDSAPYVPRPDLEEWLVRVLTPCYEGDEGLAVLLDCTLAPRGRAGSPPAPPSPAPGPRLG